MNIAQPSTKTTLLLNNAWQPITSISARASFMHLYKNRVTALDKNSNLFHSFDSWNEQAEMFDDQPVMRSANGIWAIPTVVVVTSRFFKKPKKKRMTLRDMAKLYDYTCQYCFSKFPLSDLTIDHILPRSRGGGNEHENITCACRSCNSKKGSHHPWMNVKGEIPKPAPIPSLWLNTPIIREEWKAFIK